MGSRDLIQNTVLIVGGGVTGLKAARTLCEFGVPSILVERDTVVGGRVKGYSKIFPDFASGKEIVKSLAHDVNSSEFVKILTGTTVAGVVRGDRNFSVRLTNMNTLDVQAVILACGFESFDARKQEEYGYGVYPNVITSVELESMLDTEGPTKGNLLKPSDGKPVKSVAIIFCVGSRSKRLGTPYCSRICCSFSTKQSIEIKEIERDINVTCFYMDIRTYGRGFEEMYQHAQELGVKYVRGRVSECSMLTNGDIQVKAENTLLGKPFQGIFDLISLSLGMAPCSNTEKLGEMFGIKRDRDGFFMLRDANLTPHESTGDGVFLAGAVTGLKPIRDCINDGLSVGARVLSYLKHRR